MPILSSHHYPIMSVNKEEIRDKVNYDINILVSNITFDILRDSPGLVADVANGFIERSVLETAIIKDIDKHKYHHGLSRSDLIQKVFDYMFGYGPLQEYVDRDDVSDIDGTKYNEFTITIEGVRQQVDINFGNEDNLERFCGLITIRNFGILNENDSHCRTTDINKRLRINVSIRPRNVSGPAISIRKHPMHSPDLSELCKKGMFNNVMESWLYGLAQSSCNIVVCGKGGSGKTTFLRAIINKMPLMDRILICETDPEMFPDKANCIEQRVKKKNEGGRPVTLKDLVTDGVTMSLDTYVIGESVADETWEGIKAAHTGHRFLTSTHTNDAQDCMDRLLTLSKSANIGESEKTVKEILGRCVDVIIFMKKFKVASVLEVIGYNVENDKFEYNELFTFDITCTDLNGRLEGDFHKVHDMKGRLKNKFKRG